MQYHFCNLNISVPLVSVMEQERYEDFRGENSLSDLQRIEVQVEEELRIPEGDPVFRNIQGMSVYLIDGKEYRCFRNFFTGETEAILSIEKEHTLLKISKKKIKRGYTEQELINELALERLMSEKHCYILHSSFIRTMYGAVLFTAPSGTGKSTQEDLWNRYRGSEIINGDRSGIWKDQDEWLAGGVPWCGTSGIMKNEIIPLAAIVILEQGSDNQIQEPGYAAKVCRILEQITINPWNEKMLLEAQMFAMELVKEVPVIHFSCRPDEDAVKVLEEKLENLYGK